MVLPYFLINITTHCNKLKLSQLGCINSKRVSILIEAVLPTLPMLYLPFNVHVYLDSKRVSILIEAVLPTITNVVHVPSLQCIF